MYARLYQLAHATPRWLASGLSYTTAMVQVVARLSYTMAMLQVTFSLLTVAVRNCSDESAVMLTKKLAV